MRTQRTKDEPTEVTLPITPMLDMAFQLMFFFLATFNPISAKEGQMDLTLPDKSDTAAKNPEDVSPTSQANKKEEPEVTAALIITLRSYQDPRNKGQISQLTVAPDDKSPAKEITGTQEAREEALRKELISAKPAESKDKDGKKVKPTAKINAARDLRWSQVVRVMDICYKLGYEVSFARPFDLGGQ